MFDINAIQKKCIERHKRGLNCKQIGNKLDLEYPVVSFLLKAAGFDPKKNIGKTKIYKTNHFNREVIYQMYWTKKMTIREIAKELQVSISVIVKYMDEYNIPKRNRGVRNNESTK